MTKANPPRYLKRREASGLLGMSPLGFDYASRLKDFPKPVSEPRRFKHRAWTVDSIIEYLCRSNNAKAEATKRPEVMTPDVGALPRRMGGGGNRVALGASPTSNPLRNGVRRA